MAATISASDARATEQELKVIIHPLSFWEYEGTRAQLEAEGVVPADTQWPEGRNSLYWKSGRFSYWLRRKRPDGLKGPMKLWTNGDWWFLRCDCGLSFVDRRILQKRRELEEAMLCDSPAWRREHEAEYQRHLKAASDDAFQAFKAILLPSRTRSNGKSAGSKPQ